MLKFDFNENCYGCSVCASVCPTKAIKMIPNHEGFLVPSIDASLCIDCHNCKSKCIYLNIKKDDLYNIKNSKCYAAYRNDTKKLLSSSSGGVAAVLSEYFVSNNNYVCGCKWNDNLEARHTIENTLEGIELFKGSKYIQSNLQGIHESIKELLYKNKKVLFIGTPCQTASMKNLFPKEDNLYLIALICGGVPSPLVWEKFKEENEQKVGSKMLKANFRYKGRYGWNSPVALYEFKNRKKSSKLAFQLDDYIVQYLFGVFKRNTCYHCQYKGENINADLIIGDFWGAPEFRDQSKNNGVSSVISISEKGNELVSILNSSNCTVVKTTFESILKHNHPLLYSVNKSGQRIEFFDTLVTDGYTKAVKLYGKKLPISKKIIFTVLDKTKLFQVVKEKLKG